MHAELTMKVTNEAPSSTHEWRADWGGEASICWLSFGAGQITRYLSRRLAIDQALARCHRRRLGCIPRCARVDDSSYGSRADTAPQWRVIMREQIKPES